MMDVRDEPLARHKRNSGIQDSWNNELVVRQSPAGKNVSTEAGGIFEIHHQATIGEDTAN
jgi:hypothetical protein